MTAQELSDLISDGIKPVVEFNKGIEDLESYADSGMRARVIGAYPKHGGMDLQFDFSEFDSFNQALEKSNYYDKQGRPTLTARQAGFYEPIHSYLFDLDEDTDQLFEVVEDFSLKLYDRYKAAGETVSYVRWLETFAAHALGFTKTLLKGVER